MGLQPLTAAKLADGIYSVQSEYLLPAFLAQPIFNTGTQKKLNANSGGYLIKKQSAFGVCAMGGAGYENELFIIFRGTDTAHDVISDLWIGISRSKTGLPVYHIHLFSARSV